MKGNRIAWIDSCGQPSHVHRTTDGVDTACGRHAEYIAGRTLAVVPAKHTGRSRFCRSCFKNGGKALPWDSRCATTEWIGPCTAPHTKERQ